MGIFDNLDRALRWLREERRVRQYVVAEAAGITTAMLSSYETGKQKPSLETLDKILIALDCNLCDLHDALLVFHSHSARRPAGGVPSPITPQPRSLEPARQAARSENVYATLGIDHPLEPGEEEALTEVLTSFHKLLRHMHESAAGTRKRREGHGEGDDEG